MGGAAEFGDVEALTAGSAPEPETTRGGAWPSPGLLAALLGFSAAVRLALASTFFGFGTGDDTEVVLSAFHAAFSHPYEAWEIRSLVLPELVVAPFLELASAFGVRSTDGLRLAAAVPFVLLSTASLALLHRIAVRTTGSRAVGLLAATLYALHWIPLGYASSTFPRTASTTCLLAAFLLLTPSGNSPVRPAAAGVLLALAATVRYSEVVFLPAAAGVLLLAPGPWRAKVRPLAALGLGFLATASLSMGAFDAARHGRPFSSLLAFGTYTIVGQEASSLEKTQPFWWYLWRLPKWLPLTLVPFVFLGDRRERRAAALMVLVPIGLLSLVHHKELRYLQGVVPFLCLLVAIGACRAAGTGHRRTAIALLLVSVPWLVGGLTFLGRRSMAAVEAARRISREPGVSAVAFSQAWAYGGNLYLPAVAVRELSVTPSVDELAATVPGCDRVCLWEDVVAGSPGLARLLAGHGFERAGQVRSGASRAVAVFARRAPAGPTRREP